jgi:L-alanine-DL-glutamate epimerase-like enolase superfamily enzyme
MPKIVSVETAVVPLPLENGVGHEGKWLVKHIDNVLVRVTLDDGTFGTSYIWLPTPRQTLKTPDTATIMIAEKAIHSIAANFVIGEELFTHERIYSRINADQWHMGLGMVTKAHSAIDMALWDCMGKVANLPLHKLLGGHKDEVSVYTNELLTSSHKHPEEVAEAAKLLVAKGHRGLKMPFGVFKGEDPSIDVARVTAVREAVGPEVKLMLDTGSRLQVDELIRRARAVDDLGLAWIEDPVPADQIDNLRKIKSALKTPIATGEGVWGTRHFRRLFEANAVDIVLFEPMRVGGITGCQKVAALASEFDVVITPHTYPDLGVQLIAGFASGVMAEYLPWWSKLFNNPLQIKDGMAKPSQIPGIGWDIRSELFDKSAA